jgi:hypothetical protein
MQNHCIMKAINVLLRVRPAAVVGDPREGVDMEKLCVRVVDRSTVEMDTARLPLESTPRGHVRVQFDHVFGMDSTQEDVYRTLKPITDRVFRGVDTTIFAYGATCSGKTTTILGSRSAGKGIIPRILEDAFSESSILQVTMSCFEVFHELIFDLLGDNSKPLKLLNDGEENKIQGIRYHRAKNAEDVMQQLQSVSSRRRRKITKRNKFSSRSHLIIKFLISTRLHQSVLTIVDLAGAERAGTSIDADAKFINSSLLALKKLILAMNQGQIYDSARDSSLTRLLRSSFGCDSQTVMLCGVSPLQADEVESYDSLCYAEKFRKIERRLQPRVEDEKKSDDDNDSNHGNVKSDQNEKDAKHEHGVFQDASESKKEEAQKNASVMFEFKEDNSRQEFKTEEHHREESVSEQISATVQDQMDPNEPQRTLTEVTPQAVELRGSVDFPLIFLLTLSLIFSTLNLFDVSR